MARRSVVLITGRKRASCMAVSRPVNSAFSMAQIDATQLSTDGVPAEGLSACRFALGVCGIALLHLALGVVFHWDRAFVGDEWGSLALLKIPYSRLLGMFRDWATMNFYLAGLKPIHDQLGGRNWLLVIPSLLFSCWTVVLSANLARKLGATRGGALLAGLLVATSPFLIYYSNIIRSYSALTAFCMAMLVALFGWREKGRWRDGIYCGLAAGFALLMHLNAVYAFAGVGVLAVWWTAVRWYRKEPEPIRRLIRLSVPVVVIVSLAAAAYIPQYDDIVVFREKWKGTGSYVPTWLNTAVSLILGREWVKYPTLLLLAAAMVHSFWKRTQVRWLLLLIAMPIIGLTAARLSHPPGAYARFLITVLPLGMIGIGIMLARLRGGVGRTIAAACVAVLLFTSAIHTKALWDLAMQVQFYRIEAAAEADPDAKIIIIGPPVHRYGFHQLMTFQTPAIKVLQQLPADSVSKVAVADGYGFSESLPGEPAGVFRVTTLSGTPKDIGNILAELIQGRMSKPIAPDARKDMIAELKPLLEWLGRGEEAKRLK